MATKLLRDERQCPVCGRLFYPSTQHVYYDKSKIYHNKNERILVCTFTCMRKTEKEEKKKTYRKLSGY